MFCVKVDVHVGVDVGYFVQFQLVFVFPAWDAT